MLKSLPIPSTSCEPKNEQVNYLIYEDDYVGKGGNSTISMLHHYLEHHGVRERDTHLQADNCVAQNKSNSVIQYLRSLVGCNWKMQTSKSFFHACRSHEICS